MPPDQASPQHIDQTPNSNSVQHMAPAFRPLFIFITVCSLALLFQILECPIQFLVALQYHTQKRPDALVHFIVIGLLSEAADYPQQTEQIWLMKG